MKYHINHYDKSHKYKVTKMKTSKMFKMGINGVTWSTVSAFLGIVKVMDCINLISLGHLLITGCVQSRT